MGVERREFVNAVVADYDMKNHKTRLDNLIKFMDANKKLFSYSLNLTNGENCFMMCWDGSKEGWNESDNADELRTKFIAFLNGFDSACIYHIMDGDFYDEPLLIEE